MFNEYQVTLFDVFALLKHAASFGDVTDILVAHDDIVGNRRFRIKFDIGAADAGDFHLQ